MRFNNLYDSMAFSGRVLGATMLAVSSAIAFRDVGWYVFNRPTRNQTRTTKNCYDWFEHYIPVTTGRQIDYSEGVFDFEHRPDMTLEEATINKYEYIYQKLALAPGMTLLDAGCGSGVWMAFCRSKGVNVIGLTLSPEQQKVCLAKNLDVRVQDYRVKNEKFLGQFDRITALGSTEHVCSSMGLFANHAARDRSVETLTNVWSLLKLYLKPGGKIFITTLTVNEQAKWSLQDYAQAYVLEQHYGGFYPLMHDIQYKIAPAAGLTVTDIQDQTASYHWSSMVEPKHFGYFKINWSENTLDKIAYIFISMLKSPLQFPFHWLYQMLDTWMWQFGGPRDKPMTATEVENSIMQLKYFMMCIDQIKPSPEKPLTLSLFENQVKSVTGLSGIFDQPRSLPNEAVANLRIVKNGGV